MKKLLVIALCFNFLILPVYSIEDVFVENTLNKDCVLKPKQQVLIHDDFVESSLDKSVKIKQRKTVLITDEFAEKTSVESVKREVKSPVFEEVLPKINPQVRARKLVITGDEEIVVPVRISRPFTTRQAIDEGDIVLFETTEDVSINNKIYPVGTVVRARVETISLNKSMGVPADLTIGNFSIDGIALAGEINKTGANRSLWLYPTVYALTCCFFAGLLLVSVRGGHAKIHLDEEFLLYLK